MTPRAAGDSYVYPAVPCAWCASSSVDGRRARYCSRRCRQAAFRLRRRGDPAATVGAPPGLVFCYADPPYPGLAQKRYGREPDFAGEVDHVSLVASLVDGGYAGWALSTSAKALRDVLPLCPPTVRICPWVKPIGVPASGYGPHNRWEAVLVVGGRRRQPAVRDWLRAQPARGWGTLMGRKPVAFCAWLFDLLGMVPGDQLVDLFPGSGAVTRAWRELSSRARDDGVASRSADDAGALSLGTSSPTPIGAGDGRPHPEPATPSPAPDALVAGAR